MRAILVMLLLLSLVLRITNLRRTNFLQCLELSVWNEIDDESDFLDRVSLCELSLVFWSIVRRSVS
eukprot:6187557-Pleurochrysis_carterae.AAC.2